MRIGAAAAVCSWGSAQVRHILISRHRIIGSIMDRLLIMFRHPFIIRHRFTTHPHRHTTLHRRSITARVGEAGEVSLIKNYEQNLEH
jgi:hypothetical protein